MVGAGVGHRRDIVGGDDHAVGRTVHRAIVHNELDDIVAGAVDGKGRRHAGGIRQDRGAAGRLGEECPAVGERIPVGIGAGAAIEGDERSRELAALVGAGVGHRRDIVGGDGHAVGCAVHRAIVHNELHDIVAGAVDGKGRRHAGGIRQDRGAAGRLGEECPAVGERIPVGVGTGAAVQRDEGAGGCCLGPGRHWRLVRHWE